MWFKFLFGTGRKRLHSADELLAFYTMLFSLYLLPFVHGSVLLQLYYSIFNCYHGAFADKKKEQSLVLRVGGTFICIYKTWLNCRQPHNTTNQDPINTTFYDITFQLSIAFPGQTSEPALCTLQKASWVWSVDISMQQRWDASEGFSSVQVFDVTAEPMRHYI